MDANRIARRLAIVTTHPIQYYAPWFRWIAANTSIDLRVFYLWDTEHKAKHDPGFGREIRWDVPLLEGYHSEFVPNISSNPGTSRFFGIRNPELGRRIAEYRPGAALLIGYRYQSLLRLLLTPQRLRGYPLLFRGDSHRLAAASRSPKWKVAVTQRQQARPGFPSRRRAIAAVYSRFAAFLYVGQANQEYFRLHGVRDEKLFFAPHAVDNARFTAAAPAAQEAAREWRAELGIPEDHLLILFAGKLEEKKRPLDLLAAFRNLNEPNVSLLFVGNGHLEGKLRRAASDMPHVYFAPFQNQSAMPRTYSAADLFVLPSFGPEESWGLSVNEALCLAKPVLVSSHVGCSPDLVRNGQNGLIFAAGDVSALTAALADSLRNRNRLRSWGDAGRRIVDDYDYSHATEGLIHALDFLLRE